MYISAGRSEWSPIRIRKALEGGNCYLKSASNRSTGAGDCPVETMRTFVSGTVGFSRRRGVAWNTCSSLMTGDGSIPSRRDKDALLSA